jgi:hypothetical protein
LLCHRRRTRGVDLVPLARSLLGGEADGPGAAAHRLDRTAVLDVLGALCDAAPDEALAAARARGLPPLPVPGVLWLYEVWDDGVVEPRPHRRPLAATLVTARELTEVLTSGDNVHRVIAALELVPGRLALEPDARAALAAALLSRLADERAARPGPRSGHSWPVMPPALDVYLEVVGDDPPSLLAALTSLLDSVATARYALRCFTAGARAHWPELVARLEAVATSPDETAHHRAAAAVAITTGAAADHDAAPLLATAARSTAKR